MILKNSALSDSAIVTNSATGAARSDQIALEIKRRLAALRQSTFNMAVAVCGADFPKTERGRLMAASLEK